MLNSARTKKESRHRGRPRRLWRLPASLAAVIGLVLSVLALVDAPVSAAPGESLRVSTTVTPAVLVGAPSTVRIEVVNDGDRPEYNLSLRAVLPAGVSFVAGSTAPAALGAPQQVALVSGETVLLWPNVSDLPREGDQHLTFQVRSDPTRYPVASTYEIVSDAYANASPRVVPGFDALGEQTTGATVEGTSATAVTTVTAITIDKAEPSPEHELLRGVHDHPTVYTLTVTNNGEYEDQEVVVVDLLPAQLEFLGCGGVDNSADVEYPGAPRLTGTPAVADCRAPYSVTTVRDPDGRTGIFTRVEWRLGTLAPDEVVRIRYAAGIPQRANTLDFGATTPSGTSLEQAANLDNNNAVPSTREGSTEAGLTNHASVRADYTGPVQGGTTPPTRVGDTAELTVTAEDLAVTKRVSPGTFHQGGVATFTFRLRTSEYVSAEDIVLTDVLPNGLCPIGAGLALCPNALGNRPSVAFDSVVENDDGTFRIVFEPIAMGDSAVTTVTFDALMLDHYRGGRANASPTVAGDSFTNTVGLSGTTTDVPGVDAPERGPVAVTDDSSATITGEEVHLVKRIQPNTGSTPYACSADGADYVESGPYLDPANALDPADISFTEGSRVCFMLEATFPGGAFTKNPVLADFLPDNLTYERGSIRPLSGHDAPYAVDEDDLTFAIGDPVGADRYVSSGEVFRISLSGIVNTPADPGEVDVPGNLAKLRWTNSAGRVSFLRDQERFQIPPVPPVSITKSAVRVTAVAPGTTGPLPDNSTALEHRVRAGDVVEFTATVGNNGSAARQDAQDVLGPEVWDRLPAGIDCDDVVAGSIAQGGICTDPGAAGHPTFVGDETRSAIRWRLPATGAGAVVIAPGDSHALTYRIAYPSTVSAAGVYRNDVDVASYSTESNIETLATHHPAANVDRTLPRSEEDAPAAHDDHTLRIPDAGVTKTNTTSVDDDTPAQGTNTALNYAVVGETVTYTVLATLPANTTVYDGVLADPMPTNLQLQSAVFSHSTDNGATWADLPAGWAATTSTSNARVTLPHAVDTGAENDLVRIVVTARVTAGATHNQVRTNTATFTSNDERGSARPGQNGSSSVTLVKPVPAPTKAATPAAPRAGQTVSYTVRARNVNTGDLNQHRPVLHDSLLVDCVPAGLAVSASSATVTVGTVSVVTTGVTAHGCAAGTTAIVWQVGDLAWRNAAAASGANPWPLLTYTATVSPAAGGGQAYTNTVTQTGSSLAGPVPNEESYTGTASAIVTVPGGTLTKAVTPLRVPVGDTVTYTVTAALPASVNFYDTVVVDELPTGIDPASVVLDPSSPTCRYTDGAREACAPADAVGSVSPLTASAGRHGWFLGDIAAAARPRELVVTYTAVVSAAGTTNRAGDTRTNRARLSWNRTDKLTTVTDPTTALDMRTPDATATVTVLEPSLSVAKAVSSTTPRPGETFTYTVTVRNATGTTVSPAHNVDIGDAVPAGVVVVPSTISRGGVLHDGQAGGGRIDWTDLGPIEPGGVLVLTYDARLRSPAPTTPQVNTVTVTEFTSLPDRDAGRNDYPDRTATAEVGPALPELLVTKDVLDAAPAYRGQPVRWQITVDNTGEAVAHDVDVTDALPPHWTYVPDSAQVSIAGGAADQVEPDVAGDPQQLRWENLADLAEGQRITIVLSAVPGDEAAVGSGTAHVNEAEATGRDLDDGEVVTTDDDDARTRIDSADVRIAKVATGSAVAGAETTWQLTVSNGGPDTAVGPFVVTDTLPPGVTGYGASGTGWTCSSTPAPTPGGSATITCQRAGSLASGAAHPVITVRATLLADLAAGTQVRNDAEVTARTHDPDPDNNDDDVTRAVTTVADVSIAKSLTSASLVPGEIATYSLAVRNHGPSIARGPIRVTDTLPSGLDYESFSGTGWRLVEESGQEITFEWTGGEVAVGALPAINVTATVDAGLTSAVTNRAVVSEPTDPTSGPEQPDSSQVPSTPTPRADLSLEKESIGDFQAGTEDVYRFTVTNHGPSDAGGPLTLTDTLPAGLTFVSGSATGGWSCTAAGQDLTCSRPGGLQAASGSNAVSFDITVAIEETLTGSIENEATVSSPTMDPNVPNNTDGDDTSINVRADLSLTKTLLTDPVVAGQQVTYRLAVRNHGPATSPGTIRVTDTLPVGLSYDGAAGTGWGCAAVGQVITCDRSASLASGTNAPAITVTATVGSGVGTTNLVNIGSVDGPAADPDPGNNTDRADTPVTEDTEIVLSKTTLGPDPVTAGETVRFSISVENTGASDARSVTVTDNLPAGLSLESIDGTGWTCVELVCTRDRIIAGRAAPDLIVVARVSAGVANGTRLVNEAAATTGTPGDDPANNADDAPVDVVARADLGIVKSHPTGEGVAGRATIFELTVTNHGPSDDTGPITVTDTLPVGMSYLSASAPWSCVAGGSREVACTLADGVLAGATAPTLQLQVQLAASLDEGTITNTASVDSPITDPVPGNDEDDEPVQIVRLADVWVTKTHTDAARVGDRLSFTLEVGNNGPSTARGVVVTDTLPAGLEFVAAGGDGWSCGHADGVVTCDLADPLGPRTQAEPISVEVLVLPGAYPTVENVVEVASSTTDTEPGNDRAVDPVAVPARVELSIAKERVGELVVGDAGRYRLVVTNHGPTSAPGPITVTDQLPPGLSFVAASGDGWTCAATGPEVTCERSEPIAVDDRSEILLDVEVGPAAYPQVTNTASVSSDSEDDDPDNDRDKDTSTVTPTVDLSIAKDVARQAGDQVTYRLVVTNHGPSDTVEPIVVRDRLPARLELLGASGAGWSCVTDGRLATCTRAATLEVGDSATVEVRTRLLGYSSDPLVNTASVTGGGDGDVHSDDATLSQTPPPAGGSALPNAGGPQLWLLLGGLLLLGLGAGLVRRART